MILAEGWFVSRAAWVPKLELANVYKDEHQISSLWSHGLCMWC